VTQVPTNRTAASSIAEHTSDHNIFAAQHNELDGHAADTAAHDVAATIAAAIAALIDTAPGTLNTLNELAAALGDDADFAATMTTALGGKAAASHSHLAGDLPATLATDSEVATAVSDHSADTTSVHGIADTSALSLTSHSHSGAYVAPATLTASGKGFVNHGATAGTARPTEYASIEWYGTVEPTNWVDGDTWNDPS
jgi:hypothetical protein